MRKLLHRRIKRLFRKSKVSKAGLRKVRKLQKFSMICFIANSQDVPNDNRSLPSLFFYATEIAAKYFHEILTWLMVWGSKIPNWLIFFLKTNKSFLMFGTTMAIALFIFRGQLKETRVSIRLWIHKYLKMPLLGCSFIIILLIILLLISSTDLSPIPLKQLLSYLRKIVYYPIVKIYDFVQNSSELDYDKTTIVTDNSKYGGENGKMVFLSIVTIFFLRYLLGEYKRKVFDDFPFGKFLIEIYEADMKNPPRSLING
jgi:hypothetical protein